MKLVYDILTRFKISSPQEYDEIVQECRIGLWKAFKKFEPSKAKYITYAYRAIYWGIYGYFQKKKGPEMDGEIDGIILEEPEIWEIIPENLTMLEKEIVEALSKKKTKREIAADLNIHVSRVAKLVKSVGKKIMDANK